MTVLATGCSVSSSQSCGIRSDGTRGFRARLFSSSRRRRRTTATTPATPRAVANATGQGEGGGDGREKKGNVTSASSLLGSAGLWSLLGSSEAAHAARTAGHVGGNLFQGKHSSSSSSSSSHQSRLRRNHRANQRGLHAYEDEDELERRRSPKAVKKRTNKGGSTSVTLMSVLPFLLFAGVVGYGLYSSSNDKPMLNFGGGDDKGYAVAQIQLGLLGSARLVQRDLDKIAMSADTNTRNGLHNLMQDSVIALIRSPEYWVYGNTQGKRTNSQARCESYFNEFEMKERLKFEVETQSNVQGKKASRSWTKPAKDWKTDGSYTDMNELIVVTLMVAMEEDIKLPRITSTEDMKIALNRLGSVRASSILAVELFWTPQDPDDVYSKEELITEYPDMKLI